MGFKGAIALMLKTQFGLGILSIPEALNTLGMVPGVVCVLAVAAITTWSNYVIGTFKRRHREVYGIDDAGGLMFGRIGREFFGTGICICGFHFYPEHDDAITGITPICRLDFLFRVWDG